MKKVGTCIYIHKSATNQLTEKYYHLYELIEKFKPEKFSYEIIKVNTKTNVISFIESHNWNDSHEPDVGDSLVINTMLGTEKIIKSKNQVYHHKWMFVNGDYKGFDVEKSKERSSCWTSVIPNTKDIKYRIGYKKFWHELLEKYNIEK